jgi:flagellar basal-body rod protein FlgC
MVNIPGGNMNIGSSLSALNAFSTKMDVTAKNVANVNTDGYKSSSVAIVGGQEQTVKTNIVKDNSPGPLVPSQSAKNGVVEASNVDMVKEMTQLPPTQIGYNANLKMMETNFQMQGTLLNMFA